MEMNLLISAVEWVYTHLKFSDVALALIGLFLLSYLREKLLSKGGPVMWPVLGMAPVLALNIDDLLGWCTRSLVRAGGTFHYRGVWFGGFYGILTANPANIEHILKTNFKNYPKGEYYRERFRDLLEDGIFNADDELWKEERRVAKTEMHSSRFLEHTFTTMRDLVKKKLMKLMEKMATSKRVFDLQDVLVRFTFDNICISAFGVDPGSLGVDLPEITFAKAFEEATEYTLARFLMPPFVWKAMRFLGIGSERKLKKAVIVVHAFANKIVREKRNKMRKLRSLNDDSSDLLSRLMQREYEKEEGKYFSDKYFREFITSLIIAGRDTTSVALVWFFWLVHNHPQVEKRILSEIKEIHGKRAPQETHEPFSAQELNEMVYLQAALTESLRLYPSVPMEMKQALEDDTLPDGTRVKKGARVFFSIFSMGRIESIWGKEWEEFKPERWIKEGNIVSGDQFKYVVFNAGPRLCVGKKFAYTQMKMVAAAILMRYKIKVVEGQTVVPKLTTTLYMKNGLLVTLQPRDG
ncbi:cytochrome P450 86B1 isoform X1 [Brassica rapa]|nr:cytochrome P450 86B1 isoform X2 [Brassica rapa]XP_033135656.1 cytochrome P450 86B1 isoform X1 [Brassica rapa]